MIHYNPKTWLGLIFHSYSRQVLRVLTPSIIVMGIYSTLIVYLIDYFLEWDYTGTMAFHSLLGIVLGLVLVFRMNSAYDRWWEGRLQWGALVNNTRNLAFKINAMIPKERQADRKFFTHMIPNFVYSFKEHLRKGVIFEELEGLGAEEFQLIKNSEHRPNMISSLIYDRVNKLYKEGILTGEQLFILDKEIKSFSDILGACERIKNTPIPYSYSMFIKKFIFTYIITLPFALVTQYSYATVPIVLFLFFILITIELISEEIEEPFGTDVNDLPTDEIAAKIKANVKEVLVD